MSEATVVSSMHEEEEEDDENNDDNEEEIETEGDGDPEEDNDYASISSRPNSVGGEDDSQSVERGDAGSTERRHNRDSCEYIFCSF